MEEIYPLLLYIASPLIWAETAGSKGNIVPNFIDTAVCNNQILFNPFNAQGSFLWEVKSTGASQSKTLKWALIAH